MFRYCMSAAYAHPFYAESLAEFGEPFALRRSGGWVLKRPIPNHGSRDAMGPYPLFLCCDWSKLAMDLEQIGDGIVSLVVVADPFGGYRPEFLLQCFPDLMTPFKQHFVVDLAVNA